eukprot:6484453-Alexandrium_andersonii.AAC.1
MCIRDRQRIGAVFTYLPGSSQRALIATSLGRVGGHLASFDKRVWRARGSAGTWTVLGSNKPMGKVGWGANAELDEAAV